MSDHISILERLVSGIAARRPMALMLVVERTGSAPGGKGAMMLLDTGAPALGTIGGGALEYEALAVARTALIDSKPRLLRYQLTPETSGMPCGGRITILIVPMGSSPGDEPPLFVDALERLRENAAFTVTIQPLKPDQNDQNQIGSPNVSIPDGILWTRTPESIELPASPGTFLFRLEPPPRLFVFGAGHITQALAPMAMAVGFRVEVLDDRADYLKTLFFTEGIVTRTLPGFADCISSLPVNASSFLLIATYGHRHDRVLLDQALATRAAYIGVVGSRSKRAYMFATLRESGWAESDTARVHTPVGLPIGAVTPAEIAVSILAEMIAVRRKRP